MLGLIVFFGEGTAVCHKSYQKLSMTVKMQQTIDETRQMTDSLMQFLMDDDQDEAMAVLEKKHQVLQIAIATIHKAEAVMLEAEALLESIKTTEQFLMELDDAIMELEHRIDDCSHTEPCWPGRLIIVYVASCAAVGCLLAGFGLLSL